MKARMSRKNQYGRLNFKVEDYYNDGFVEMFVEQPGWFDWTFVGTVKKDDQAAYSKMMTNWVNG